MRKIGVVLCILIVSTLTPGKRAADSGTLTTDSPQDAVYLDRRISMLETRLSSIESSLRSLQQQTMISERTAPAQPARDPEVTLLRSEVEILSSRLREVECALVRLDERTLSTTVKEARRRSAAQTTDPCRVNSEMPILLSPRR
jgi:predicted  nucleic acid-binding Zn-ribbon protein